MPSLFTHWRYCEPKFRYTVELDRMQQFDLYNSHNAIHYQLIRNFASVSALSAYAKIQSSIYTLVCMPQQRLLKKIVCHCAKGSFDVCLSVCLCVCMSVCTGICQYVCNNIQIAKIHYDRKYYFNCQHGKSVSEFALEKKKKLNSASLWKMLSYCIYICIHFKGECFKRELCKTQCLCLIV